MGFLKKLPFKKYIYYCLLSFLFLLVAILIWRFFVPGNYERRSLTAGDCKFLVELALEPAQQYRGLSERESLAKNRGMLFIFAPPSDETFVMRKMNFPLDIIFIKDHRVVNLYHNLPPEGKDPENSYHSGVPIDAVLEINAGLSRDCRLGVGSEITW